MGGGKASNAEAQAVELPKPRLVLTKEEEQAVKLLPTQSCFGFRDLQRYTNNFSQKIGEGGFGSVFRGRVSGTGAEIAVKRLDQAEELAQFVGITAMQQFINEVQALSQHQHPSILTLLGWAVEVAPCIVYEYMAYGSLDERLECRGGSAPLDQEARLRCACDVTQGLAYLHKVAEMVHGDIKSANILLDEAYHFKIGDFGLVRRVSGREGKAQQRGHPLQYMQGTAPYVAPEVHQGRISIDIDMYALGVLLLELLTGLPASRPTPHHATIKALADEHWDEECKLLPLLDSKIQWRDDIASELTVLAEQCVDQHPNRRPRANEKANELKSLLKSGHNAAPGLPGFAF